MRLLTVATVLLGHSYALYAAEPFEGTWKFDPAKSTGSLPKAETVVVQRHGATLTVEISITLPDDRAMLIKYSAPSKGGTGSVEQGPYNGVMVQRVNSRSMETTYLTDGKGVRSTRVVLDKDGKTMTSTGKVLNSTEQAEWTMVFQKQPPGKQ
jgi:hypothetical protein